MPSGSYLLAIGDHLEVNASDRRTNHHIVSTGGKGSRSRRWRSNPSLTNQSHINRKVPAQVAQEMQTRRRLILGGFGVTKQGGANPLAAQPRSLKAIGQAVDISHQWGPELIAGALDQ